MKALVFGLACLLPVTAALAETPEEKGLRIAQEADASDSGFADTVVTGRMVLRNRRGQESVRDFRSMTLEVPDDGDKSIIVFDRPRDIRKTALLTYARKLGDDAQWLFLPALKRVKRISSANQSGSFVGSEFSYEDMSRQAVEKFTHLWLRDEPCPGDPTHTCHVNERRPKNRKSGYRRQIVWLDVKEYRVFKIDYYDRKRTLLKTLSAKEHKLYKNKFWRPEHVVMSNHQNGKSTRLEWGVFEFGVGLTEQDFTVRALERGIRIRTGER